MKKISHLRQIFLSAGGALALVALGNIALADGPAAKPAPYPLQTCVVSGEKLGEMGAPHTFTHQGREIKLCCKGCLKDFHKDPAKYLKKLEEAEKAGKSGNTAWSP